MDVIRKTRNKFIAITVIASMSVLIIIFGMLNSIMYLAVRYSSESFADTVLARRGFIFFDGEESDSGGLVAMDRDARYFYVRENRNSGLGPYISTNLNERYSSDEIMALAGKLGSLGKDEGVYNDFYFKTQSDDIQTAICAVDMSFYLTTIRAIVFFSLLVIGFGTIFVVILTFFLSRRAIRPLANAFEKQKQFISDASHELKTPLSVIASSADILEGEIGPNKWLSNIIDQSAIMNDLTHELLDLAKLDETSADMEKHEFDLSSLVLSTALSFEAAAFETGRILEENIQEGISYYGNEASIKHLVTILVDNAVKHSDEHGQIRVTLEMNSGKRIFQVFNTGNGIRDDEKEKIFERFYRSDESRSRETGGYGLGLSIAKAITAAHSGVIRADGEEGKWVSFTVIL